MLSSIHCSWDGQNRGDLPKRPSGGDTDREQIDKYTDGMSDGDSITQQEYVGNRHCSVQAGQGRPH